MAVIGIDLGTTNSLAAYWKDGKSQLLPNCAGEYLTPSVVSYVEEEGKNVVGKLAKLRLSTHKEMTQASFKRFMGTEKKFYLGGKSYFAYELSAMVLEKIKKEAELSLGENIEEAIITVPAYFNDKQRSDTKKAAQLAGLTVNRLINEPSAAALAYRMRGQTDQSEQFPKEEKSFLVFDFGGGTLDLSLVECFDNVIEIVGVVGDNNLGGDDIDLCIAYWFCEQKHWNFQQLGLEKQQILLKNCERAKQKFVNEEQVTVFLGEEKAELTEEVLFELCIGLFSKIKNLFLRILKDTGYCISDIDDLIMVGGSSKLLVLRSFLAELLGKEPVILAEPDCVVAIGAGVYAGIRGRKEEIRDIVLTDVCPFTLGIRATHSLSADIDDQLHDYLLPIIERNATLPAKSSRVVVNAFDYQAKMRIQIYQGDAYCIKDNLFLGEIVIELLPKPVGEARVEVIFTYDLNGILQVEAINEKGQRKEILLSNRDMTEEEIKEKMKDMQQMLFSDEKQLQIQMQYERITAYYEKAVGEERVQIESFLGWYEHEINSKKQYRQKRAIDVMEQKLALFEQVEDSLESYLFDGEGNVCLREQTDGEIE